MFTLYCILRLLFPKMPIVLASWNLPASLKTTSVGLGRPGRFKFESPLNPRAHWVTLASCCFSGSQRIKREGGEPHVSPWAPCRKGGVFYSLSLIQRTIWWHASGNCFRLLRCFYYCYNNSYFFIISRVPGFFNEVSILTCFHSVKNCYGCLIFVSAYGYNN